MKLQISKTLQKALACVIAPEKEKNISKRLQHQQEIKHLLLSLLFFHALTLLQLSRTLSTRLRKEGPPSSQRQGQGSDCCVQRPKRSKQTKTSKIRARAPRMGGWIQTNSAWKLLEWIQKRLMELGCFDLWKIVLMTRLLLKN